MPVQEQSLILIGELKKRSSIPVKTLRYYEDLGLIHAVKRTEGGFRLFSVDVLSRLVFIKRSQALGFSLQEIKEILQIHDQGQLPCDAVVRKVKGKVAEIDQRIEALQALKAELLDLFRTSPSKANWKEDVICPVIQGS